MYIFIWFYIYIFSTEATLYFKCSLFRWKRFERKVIFSAPNQNKYIKVSVKIPQTDEHFLFYNYALVDLSVCPL